MPVTFPNHYTLTVHAQSNDAVHQWANSIDIVTTGGAGAPGPTDAIVAAFENMLQGLLRTDAQLWKSVMRPWTRGVQPFGTSTFIWENLYTKTGTAYDTGIQPGVGQHNPVLGEVVMKLTKTNFTGGFKSSHLYLRDLFRDIDITAHPGAPPVLSGTSPGPDATTVNAWIVSKIGIYLQENPLPRFCNVHWSKKPGAPAPSDTPIGAILSTGVTMHDLSHKSKK